MLDVTFFRVDQGGDPEIVRESQRRRYADVGLVDKVIELDGIWRNHRATLDNVKYELNRVQDQMKVFYKEKKPVPDALTSEKSALDAKVAELSDLENAAIDDREKTIGMIGNIVHDSVIVSDNEDLNQVVRTNGQFANEPWMLSHVDLVMMAGMADSARGSDVAGNRGYFLTGPGVMLNQALIQYGLQFLSKKGFTPIQTPFFMKQSIMGKVAQLAQFDEELYKVTGEGDDKYLIATSEQPICAFHLNEWIAAKDLPRRLAGVSTCFRKEAGSHGRDQLGIFRVHQFEKIEQFVVTSPEGDISWREHEAMIANSEDFYKSLGIPFRVVSIVSGALNDAAAKKYDLEAWFPGSKAHRELVSCSNCTDFQSRRLGCRFGVPGTKDAKKEYTHMLNSTLTATERTICCLVENYQTPIGIRVPPALVPFMNGVTFIPFTAPFSGKLKKGEEMRHHVPTADELVERANGEACVNTYLQQHGVEAALNAALNQIIASRPADPLSALAALLGQGVKANGPAATATAAVAHGEASGMLDEAALLKLSITERADYERKHKKKGGGGIEFDPSDVAEDGGDATLDDFFGALGVSGGGGMSMDDAEEAPAKKPEPKAEPAKQATHSADSSDMLDEAALLKLSITERADYERKHKKKGGGGIEFDPSDVAEDGGDASLDDFLSNF